MWCSSGRHSPELVICSDLIQPVQSVHNLGIWLDSDCSMTTHIKLLPATYPSGKFIALPLHSHLMCRSFSLHLLSYQRLTMAIQLWSVYLPITSSNFSVSSTAAKIINNKRKHDHVTPLLHDLHWLCICQRIDYKISAFVFKSLLGHALGHTCLSLTPYIPDRHGLRSATMGSLVKSSAKLVTLDGRSIDVVSPHIWNRLPPSITNTDPAGFHSALKTFLFRESFPLH